MEKLLVRLAQQLDAIDEASLIQAKRWKNQLFNYHWSRQAQPLGKGPEGGVNPMPDFELERPEEAPVASKCRVLEFKPSRLEGQDPADPKTES